MRRAMFRWIVFWWKPIPVPAPVPHRGKENQPAMTRDVAEYMAVLKGVSIEELARVTTKTSPACSISTPPACNLSDTPVILGS